MKFSDIDFSAISRMMDNMSDEEKEKLNNMAQNMMDDYQNKQADEPEEETDMYEFLQIEEDDYSDIPGIVLDEIDAAVDYETFYEDVKDQDFSASVLFYSKAVLNMLRKYHYPIYKNVLHVSNFNNESTTTIYSYFMPLMNDETIYKLVDEGFGTPQGWSFHKNNLQQIYILLNRAEYDTTSYEDVQALKDILFSNKGLLLIKELI